MLIQYANYIKGDNLDDLEDLDLYTLPEEKHPTYFKNLLLGGGYYDQASLEDLAEVCIEYDYHEHDGWDWGDSAPDIVLVVDGRVVGIFETEIDWSILFRTSLSPLPLTGEEGGGSIGTGEKSNE